MFARTSNYIQSLCSADLDRLYVQERVALPVDFIQKNGNDKYSSFVEEFKKTYANDLAVSFETFPWQWKLWKEV